MNSTTQNVIAVIVGLVCGMIINMGLVTVGPAIIPPPQGVDMTNMDGLKEGMKLFEPKNFLFPFLAHAFGTLIGAFIAAKISVTHSMRCAMIIGFVFLLGGIMMVYKVGGPTWFIVADLVLAYIPMGLLGGFLASKKAS